MSRAIIRSFVPRHYGWIDEAHEELFMGFHEAFHTLYTGKYDLFYDLLLTHTRKIERFRIYKFSREPASLLTYPEIPERCGNLFEEERVLVAQYRGLDDNGELMISAARFAMNTTLGIAPLPRYAMAKIEIWKGDIEKKKMQKHDCELLRFGHVRPNRTDNPEIV